MYISPNIDISAVASNADMQTVLTRASAARASLWDRLAILAAGGAGELTTARAALLSNLDELVSLGEQRKIIAGGPGFIVIPGGTDTDYTEGAANTYGAWAELIAATTSAVLLTGFWDSLVSGVTYRRYANMQIGVGASGSEIVQATFSLPYSVNNMYNNDNPFVLGLPIPVPTGTRIAVRGRSSTGSDTHAVFLQAIDPANTQKWSA